MHVSKLWFLALALGLTACAGPATQVLIPPSTPSLRIKPAVSSIVVQDISLPRYAASDDLVVIDSNGVLQSLPNTIWADTPERGLTLDMARDLGKITGARVSTEPWPFSDTPQARVTIRVTRLLGQANGVLLFSGQYAVAPVDSGISDKSDFFDISVPMAGKEPADLAQAVGKAMSQLAETIARRMAR